MPPLPHFKGDKSYQVTGKNTVNAMIFGNDALAQHAGVLILTLFINHDLFVGHEIIPWIYNSAMGIQAIALVINIISHYIQARADGNRNVRSFGEKLEKELQQLPASVFVMLRQVTILAFYRKVIVNKVWRLQHKMIVECN